MTGDVEFIPEDEEREVISIRDVNADEWLRIHMLAIQLRNSGAFGGHEGKCWIASFVHFLEFEGKMLTYDEDDFNTIN